MKVEDQNVIFFHSTQFSQKANREQYYGVFTPTNIQIKKTPKKRKKNQAKDYCIQPCPGPKSSKKKIVILSVFLTILSASKQSIKATETNRNGKKKNP